MARVITTQPTTDHAGLSSRSAATRGSGDFDAIYRRYRRGLVRYAQQRSAQDAEGVANLALLDLARAYDRLRSTEAPVLRAYLYKAARSHLARERSGPATVSLDVDHFDDADAVALTPFDNAVAQNLDLDALLANLSAPQEQALRLKFHRQMTSVEAAAVMDVDASTVRTHQRRGLARLRQLMLAALVILIAVGIATALRTGYPDLILNSPVAPVETPNTITGPGPTTSLPDSPERDKNPLLQLPEEVSDTSDDVPTAAISPATPPPVSTPPSEVTADSTESDGAEPPAVEPPTPAPADPAYSITSEPPALAPEPEAPISTEPPVVTLPAQTTSTVIPSTTLPIAPEPTTATTSPGQFDPLSVFESSIFWLSSFVAGNDCLAQAGTNLAFVAESCRDGIHPRWRATYSNNSDTYQIMDVTLTSCWTYDISSNVTLAPCTGAANQMWSIVYVGGYRITSVLDSRCLGIEGEVSGSNIVVADCVADNHQTWGVYWQAL